MSIIEYKGSIMSYVIKGLYDYLKDCHHDRLVEDAMDLNCILYEKAKDVKGKEKLIPSFYWKEGNLWHYIKQRKIAKKAKNAKR